MYKLTGNVITVMNERFFPILAGESRVNLVKQGVYRNWNRIMTTSISLQSRLSSVIQDNYKDVRLNKSVKKTGIDDSFFDLIITPREIWNVIFLSQ